MSFDLELLQNDSCMILLKHALPLIIHKYTLHTGALCRVSTFTSYAQIWILSAILSKAPGFLICKKSTSSTCLLKIPQQYVLLQTEKTGAATVFPLSVIRLQRRTKY